MKFGVFYELQLPKPWRRDDEYELLNHALDQVELADRLGFDYAWEVEHHSRSAQPLQRFRGVPRRRQPAHHEHPRATASSSCPPTTRPVAERVSTLDLLSHGRAELGVGEGSSVTELHPFDRRFRDKRAVWEDAMRCLMPMFWEGGLGVPR